MSQRVPTVAEVDAYAKAIVLEGKTKTDAFRIAFPKTKCARDSINAKASAFDKIVKVRLRIEELKTESRKISEQVFKVTAEDKKKALLSIIRAAARLDANLESLGEPSEENQKPNYSAAVAAIAEMNRMDGDHAPVKSDIKTKITGGKKRWQVELVDPGAKK